MRRFTDNPRRRPRERGFTLTELVLVLVILGVLAAVAGPRFFGHNAFQGRGFYDEVKTAARYAQRLAEATQCTVRFSFDGGARAYSLTLLGGAGCLAGAAPHPADGKPYAGTAPAGITMVGGPLDVDFDGGGRSTLAGALTLEVGGRAFTIEADTGFVH